MSVIHTSSTVLYFFIIRKKDYFVCAYWPFRISRSVIGWRGAVGYMKRKESINDKGLFRILLSILKKATEALQKNKLQILYDIIENDYYDYYI